MAIMSRETFLTFLLLIFSKSLCFSRNGDLHVSRTLSSLEKVVDFYVRSIDKVNLDSIFGLRIAEGSITRIVERFHLQSDVLKNRHFIRINSLLKTVKRTAKQALPYLKEYQPEYYQKFTPVVEKPWPLFNDFRNIKSVYRKEKFFVGNSKAFPDGQNFNEKVSDKCMTEIMGTAVGQKNPCYVSVDCLNLMTSKTLKRYGNTHQVIYFLLGLQSKCGDKLERELSKLPFSVKKDVDQSSKVDDLLEKKCGQIFNEMRKLEAKVITQHETDLFLEQGLVCGILGFKDFLSYDILQKTLSWQDREHGCFGTEISRQKRNNKDQKLNSINTHYDAKRFVSRITMRKLLFDRPLANGCSSHETGVATGLLSIYLRWLLFSNPEPTSSQSTNHE